MFDKDSIIVLEGDDVQKYQKEVLSVAEDMIRFFDENKIRYSLSGGSILGAVRHQGFIPWDDDIDLNMPRKDYDKMCDLFDEKLGDRYFLQTPEKRPELGLMLTQIRKKGTVARRKYDWESPAEECGVSIDLYVMENVFDDPLRHFIQKNMSMFLTFAVSSVRFRKNMKLPEGIEEMESRKYNYPAVKKLIGRCFAIIPLKQWINWCIFWNKACHNSKSKYVAIPTGRKHFAGETYLRSEMCRFRKVPFENCQFNIPVGAKKFLRKFYGNYMEIPPVEKREKHIFLELSYGDAVGEEQDNDK